MRRLVARLYELADMLECAKKPPLLNLIMPMRAAAAEIERLEGILDEAGIRHRREDQAVKAVFYEISSNVVMHERT